jgi:exodeoxyribonuclease-1
VTFILYDVETTGLNRRFDQILQFAAVRTDVDLVETGRFERRSR